MTVDPSSPVLGVPAGPVGSPFAKYEALVHAELTRLRASVPPVAPAEGTPDDATMVREGRFAALEAVHGYGGWGMDEEAWVRLRVRRRMAEIFRGAAAVDRI